MSDIGDTEARALLERLEPLLTLALEGAERGSLSPDAELSLRSIEVITLVDLLEAELDLTLSSEDVRPEHFATRRSIVRLLARLGAR